MQFKINGQQPFQILSDSFSISPSLEGYTLQVSADGENYSDLFQVSPNTTKMCTGMANGSYYRLSGNNSEVTVNWRTTCKGGEGGGGGQYILPPATEQTLGGIKVGDGLSITNDGTLSTSGGTDPEAIQEAIDANNELLEGGDIVVGMAKQLYSPDGTTSDGTFAYRTTAGDADVTSGPANLMKVMGNATYPQTEYNDSAVLMREGSEVEGFDADFAWGDTATYVEWNTLSGLTVAERAELGYKVIRANNDISGYGKIRFLSSAPSAPNVYVGLDMEYNNGVWAKATSNVEVVDENRWIWKHPDNASIIIGDVYYENGWLYVTINNPSTIARWSNLSLTGFNATNIQLVEGAVIPNDIPYGESTYTYDGSDWTPSLPQAVTAMTLNSETYSPESGDEIVINRSLSKTGSASYPQPYSFVALGLNSFSKDGSPINSIEMDEIQIQVIDDGADYNIVTDSDYAVYAIKAVTGLSNGYVVYHKSGSSISWAGVYDHTDMVFSATIRTDNYDVVFPTAEFPYIVFSARKDEEGMICVHPRWSGYMDEEYEDYSESVLDLHTFNAVCPLVSVGTTKNVWDFENGKLIKNIDVIDYSADEIDALINDGKTLGTDFDFDEYYIYEVSSDPVETSITFDNGYDANDFSVEYFTDANDSDISVEAAGAETYYMQNLVDKLRRMEGLVHLDNLNGTGDENTLYEADGYLWYWSSTSGAVAEWTNKPNENGFGSTRGYGLIFSHIPDGQTILEAKYQYDSDSEYKAFKMSGGTLVMTNSANTVLSACTVGNTAEMRVRNNSSSYVVRVYVKEHMIGFDMVGILSFRNIWDGKVSGGHFCITDHYNYPYLYGVTTDSGIPRWNNKGQIVGKDSNFSTRNLYFNTTGSSTSNRLAVLTNGGNNGPDHLFVPSQSGTQGQILQSNGNAEPTWINWIKAVKITSDAYEALTVKDPNVLYLIDDNV